MRLVLAAVLVVAGCGGKESKKDGPAPASSTPTSPDPPPPTIDACVAAVVQPDPPLEGYDFTPIAHALLVVGACGDGPLPDGYSQELVTSHCAEIKKAQAEYSECWLRVARPFIAERVPKDIPKKIVYPFAGGDLSTALTVYPDADEITTLSLEPAGDPRTLDALNAGKSKAALAKALGTVRYELNFLYRVNFSNTMNMIDAMRGGALPTQLIFGLSALKVHGYEVVSLRYFKLDDEGVIKYLSDADVKKAPAITPGTADFRNRIFANAELRFRK